MGRITKHWTNEELLDSIISAMGHLGPIPTMKDYTAFIKLLKEPMPSAKTIASHFEGWPHALREAHVRRDTLALRWDDMHMKKRLAQSYGQRKRIDTDLYQHLSSLLPDEKARAQFQLFIRDKELSIYPKAIVDAHKKIEELHPIVKEIRNADSFFNGLLEEAKTFHKKHNKLKEEYKALCEIVDQMTETAKNKDAFLNNELPISWYWQELESVKRKVREQEALLSKMAHKKESAKQLRKEMLKLQQENERLSKENAEYSTIEENIKTLRHQKSDLAKDCRDLEQQRKILAIKQKGDTNVWDEIEKITQEKRKFEELYLKTQTENEQLKQAFYDGIEDIDPHKGVSHELLQAFRDRDAAITAKERLEEQMAEKVTIVSDQVLSKKISIPGNRDRWMLLAHFARRLDERFNIHCDMQEIFQLDKRAESIAIASYSKRGTPVKILPLQEKEVFAIVSPDITDRLTLTTAYTREMWEYNNGYAF